VLATVTSGAAMSAVQGRQVPCGTLLIVGVPEDSLAIDPLPLILGSRSVSSWYSGTSIDSRQTLAFSRLTGVCPMTEIYPLERTAEAYDRMMSGN
jgi:D-arabinose 1-dehydrogenase-like Zn-dependent alcohol dehydrogenase